MLDFTSSLYLGMWHEAWSLRPWSQLTTGKPAALATRRDAQVVAEQLARLVGCERATLASSTLHVFWDLFAMLSQAGIVIYLEAGAYPIARWGVERAAVRGVPVIRFDHKDIHSLQQAMNETPHSNRRPVIVADGICTCCGCVAPITAYHEIVHAQKGWLVVDDTQAFGLMGHSTGPEAPYGRGGGGSLQRSGVRCGEVIVVNSLAKAFGVPMAMLAGSMAFVNAFESHSQTRLHCSPPSAAEIHAAQHALTLNESQGDQLRLQLAERVRYFRRQLAHAGLRSHGRLFPMQTIVLPDDTDGMKVHQMLLEQGVQTVLQADKGRRNARISFILTVRHRADEIESAVNMLAEAIANQHATAQIALPHG